ncbi:hypothetical protein FCH28_11170 [Streptomyces piniterrae]|uniref:Secreted protein n=1 Tax=Streptomyces piniterrae TaxID=2571125 RepID=A0A4U0NN86_9ACTN|nr:hypothetical protein [Streptomyces piniterrae]TJZ55845.1 hypothetical protein FCH28_11170 [Streptomyces piniterrae]
MKIRKRVATGAVASVLMIGSAAALTAAAPASAAPSTTAVRHTDARIANELNCTTTSDGRTGTADCTNNTNRTIAFRATVVCGEWPDQTGPWKTLNPGARDNSAATCEHGTGVGSVGREEG